jgi:charged multivesicular body protein 6
LAKTDNQLDNIEQLTHTLEFTQIEHEVIKGLRMGNDCLKQLNDMMSLDEIEDIMDDTREAMEHQKVN